jgi:hypothetical protein
MLGRSMNDKMERKEAVVAYLKVLSRHKPGSTEENHGQSQSG